MAFSCSWCSRTLRDHHASIVCNGYCSWRCNTEVENQQKQRRAELKERQKSGGGCFITTAACEVMGLPEDCRELQVLRGFRDGFMAGEESTRALVATYYSVAPAILSHLGRDPARDVVLRSIFERTITPAVNAVERGDSSTALALYSEMMEALQHRLPPGK